MKTRLLFALLLTTTAAPAASYSIDWLDMSATSIGSTITSPSFIYLLPGYGQVSITYDSVGLNWTRAQAAIQQNGSVVSGSDTYSWTTKDSMDAVNFAPKGTSQDYIITFTFLDGPVPAGQLALGSAGLGGFALSGPTEARVFQNGTFLGDYDLGANFGPTDFSTGPGFLLKNSLTEPTPGFFNTDFGVTRIDDSVTSLTLRLHHVGQDGIGFNIGLITPVPEPSGILLSSLGLVGLLRRRRHSA